MAHKLLHSLLDDTLPQHWFPVLADETRDISNREQLLIYIRWVSEMYEIDEDVIGLVQLDSTTAKSTYTAIMDTLLQLGMQFENCRGQRYDDAKHFQGRFWCGKRFQEKFPCAITVHSVVHCIDLRLHEVAHEVKPIKKSFHVYASTLSSPLH